MALPPNIGLTGKGLAGTMNLAVDHFEAKGIPLTEFRDSAPTTPYPFQLATITVRNASTGAKLAENIVVAPVSTEMHCDYCHSDRSLVYAHTLRNIGNISDTYSLARSESQSWSTVLAQAGGLTITLPGSVTLMPGQMGLITVTVNVPMDAITGTVNTTIVTATSVISPTRLERIVDTTLVPSSQFFMPVIMRN